MKEFLSESIIFGAVLSLAPTNRLADEKKFKLAILNPLPKSVNSRIA